MLESMRPDTQNDAPRVELRALDTLWFQVAGTLCNLACHHCLVSASPTNRTHEHLTLATVQRHLAEAADLGTGLSATVSFAVAALFLIIYSGFVMGDSASLTAGAAAAAAPGYRGATLAVHSILGFSGALLGPLIVGLTLDLAGGQQSTLAWFAAFAAMGFGSIAGAAALWRLGRSPGAVYRTEASRGS